MKCPNCEHAIDAPPGFSRGVCPACAGIWISGRALRAMLGESDEPSQAEQTLNSILELDFTQSQRRCPSCAVRHLKAVNIEGTELDFCASCKGLFFDPGELERVFPGIQGAGDGSAAGVESGFWVSLLKFIDRL